MNRQLIKFTEPSSFHDLSLPSYIKYNYTFPGKQHENELLKNKELIQITSRYVHMHEYLDEYMKHHYNK